MSGRYDDRGQRYSPHASHQEHPPSSTLLLRGLAPSVDDEMILRMLQPFRPSQARTMFDKATGEPRGFAFVDFDRVESAMEAMRAFESRPLVLQHRQVTVSYTDSFRRRSPDGDAGRPRGGSVGSRYGDVHHDTGERWQPRPDWICDECNVTNFARRTSCFQCSAPKTAQTKEVPVTAAFRAEQTRSYSESHRGDSGRAPSFSAPPAHDGPFKNGRRDESVPPSQVLMVRHLPPDIEEGELQVVFAEFDGVQDIRLIRDRATNVSRGFGFIEFRDIEAATEALRKCGDFVVQNTHVEVSYARDTLSTRSHFSADPFQGAPRAGSSMAVTALEQAQWSLSQGRGADAAKTDQNLVAADVSALLDSAAAEVMPHFEEPKKMWPQPFETAGGSYVYASEYGLYWDPDSMFYYDAQTKVYHNSFTGVYYRCVSPTESGAAAFQVFVPPVPVDATTFQEHTEKTSTANKPALSLLLKKDKKKASGISFGIKTTAFAPAVAVFEKENQVKTASTAVAASVSAVSVTSVGMKRKSADDIAKWSQRQRETKAQEHEGSNAASSQPRIGDTAPAASASISSLQQKTAAIAPSNAVDSVIDALTSVPQEVPICLLCRRKFGSLEMLHKHEKLSKLHLANLAKAKENKQHIAAQYREHEKEMERDAKKQRQEERAPSSAAPGISQWDAPAPAPVINPNPEPTASSLESGIGGKMLKMMGWKSGEGLGKHGKGITAPIKAAGQGGRSDTAGLGSKAPLSASVDLSDVTSDKERRQRMTRARYDADST
ncbi:hypothetical protein PF005_g12988 [Phytophthora fragariae]|uniref:RNA-binding protein n=1 Tax=Phytophthora fragariae TaxID=53985 RepID=A0A6A3YVW3_9STRA|nr:hypothetical protein PF003_g3398 [Phytophthora fragariae]KAE8935940.1 hypothetical protein PF009_g14133 [Phytophthora fragariae]KAE9005978.1 hypothetical protein PF011_g11808 [Phytophthora fragariae]KAE9106931.1 hypothetical protein PF007_g13227 [Phytophthora fragariae]KAE9142848.1 hypothetical protein PF006_g12089 [Phytophthora fragariae]